MIVELREVRKKEGRAKANAIYALQARGAIKTYKTKVGNYTAYDTEDYERYKATVHHGRPLTRKCKEVK